MRRSPIDSAFEAAADLAEEARTLLATEQGRRMRAVLAGTLIMGAPVLSRLPILRRTLLGRLLGAAALAALVVKGAEWVRDWEPRPLPLLEAERTS
jgi:hypothetical protein